MGFTRERFGKDGKPRYTAYYKDVKGKERSAGTFSDPKAADRAWQTKEVHVAEGRAGDPARGRMLFRRYVEDKWLPNHQMQPSTRQNYTYTIDRYIMPEFESQRMIDVLPEHVREWITRLQDEGVEPPTINYCKIILSAVFTTAFNDNVTFLHPCRGVKTPSIEAKPLEIVTPEQFDDIYMALPDADTQLLVETKIESGLRWGELTELRVKDLNILSHILTVSRAVIELNPKFHPKGERFWVKSTKSKKIRRFKLSSQIVEKLRDHQNALQLDQNDLLFSVRVEGNPWPRTSEVPAPTTLGMTEPNEHGRSYRHGTPTAYGAGKCRCVHCKAAVARYRAMRRAQGKDSPRGNRARQTDEDGHMSNDWFRRQVWYPAVQAAGLGRWVRIHDLRHAHASWLLAGGADLQVVKERLGHASIATTQRYLHTLPEADESAVDALSQVRSRSKSTSAS